MRVFVAGAAGAIGKQLVPRLVAAVEHGGRGVYNIVEDDPAPVVEWLPAQFWSWRLWAACRQADRDLFFSPDGERGLAKRRRERAAKAVCASCPVREDCAFYAIGNHERYGVWGGLSEHERELIWRDLSPVRQRPLRGAVRSHADDPATGVGGARPRRAKRSDSGGRTKDPGRGLLDRGPAPRSLAEGRSRRPTRETGRVVPDEQRRMSWTEADVPDQSDRVAVVTGANTGIGYDTARVLAQHGAVVVLGCRNQAKAKDAATQIAGRAPGAQVEVLDLDLSDLSSVRAAAETVASTHDRIDLLVNNAGVRMTPYATTPDGFELQFATNHLGHFALTGLLLDRIMAAPRSRIVTVSSNLHRLARIDFDDVQAATNYRPRRAYAQSKLANLLFTYELQRRLEAARSTTLAVAAHPGIVDTELHRNFRAARTVTAVVSLLGQKSARGALPTLRAATDPDVQGGEYYGPRGLFELRGAPTRRQSSDRSHDVAVASRLWDVSEQLTGVSYPLGGRS